MGFTVPCWCAWWPVKWMEYCPLSQDVLYLAFGHIPYLLNRLSVTRLMKILHASSAAKTIKLTEWMSLFLHLSFFCGRRYFYNHNTAAFQLFYFNIIFCLIDPLLKLLYSLGSLNTLMTQTHGRIFYSRDCAVREVDPGSCISSVCLRRIKCLAWIVSCWLLSLLIDSAGIMAILQEAT